MSRTHELKCWPEPFDAIVSGRKRFEFRLDDRGYAVGDVLDLRKWDPRTFCYIGPRHRVTVTYILRRAHGMPPCYACMSIEPAAPPTPESAPERGGTGR